MERTFPIMIVTKGNTDGSILAGDRVCYSPDGSLNLLHPQYGGWMSKDELTNRLQILNDLYGDVYIPEAVYRELNKEKYPK